MEEEKIVKDFDAPVSDDIISPVNDNIVEDVVAPVSNDFDALDKDVLTPASIELATPEKTEEVTENSNTGTYDKISKLNMALDELANDLTIDELMGNSNEENVNEITIPEVSNEEFAMDLENNEETKEELVNEISNDDNISNLENEEETQEELAKEITEEEPEEVEEGSSKGQFILIGILTIILVALLIAMVMFTNAL